MPLPRAFRSVPLVAAAVLACSAGEGERAMARSPAGVGGGAPPDSLPVMANAELPFRYPTALYERKVQGNVTLRLFIDSLGEVHPESTTVVESSGYPPLDSAAVVGSRELHFRPATARGTPVPVSVLFPVFFRHPEAAPLPGDTILKRE
jgi:TonB family protein